MPDPLEPPLTPAEKARAKFLDDTAELMRLPAFRRWAWHFTEADGWCETDGHGANTVNVNAMYFALGKREIGVLLRQVLKSVAGEFYKQMLLEAINLKTQRQLRAEGKLPPRALD